METTVRTYRSRRRGPVPRFEGPTVNVWTRVPEETAERLDAFADRKRLSRSEVLRRALDVALQEETQ